MDIGQQILLIPLDGKVPKLIALLRLVAAVPLGGVVARADGHAADGKAAALAAKERIQHFVPLALVQLFQCDLPQLVEASAKASDGLRLFARKLQVTSLRHAFLRLAGHPARLFLGCNEFHLANLLFHS